MGNIKRSAAKPTLVLPVSNSADANPLHPFTRPRLSVLTLTNIGSASDFKPYSSSLPLLASAVPPASTAFGGSPVMEKLLRTTTPPASVRTHRYAYPDKSSFRGSRFQSTSPTRVERHQLPIRTFTSQWLCCSQQRILNGSRYTVELCIDPEFLQVPHRPDFSSGACRITTASEALVCCTRHPLSVGPADRSFTDFHYLPGRSGHFLPHAVSWSPNPVWPRPVGSSRRKGFHLPALFVTWRAPLRAPRFTALSSTGVSMTGDIRLLCLSRGAWPPPDSSSWLGG